MTQAAALVNRWRIYYLSVRNWDLQTDFFHYSGCKGGSDSSPPPSPAQDWIRSPCLSHTGTFCIQRNSPPQRQVQAQDLDLCQCYLSQDLPKTPLILDGFGSWHQSVWFPGAGSHALILHTQQKRRSHYLCTLSKDSLKGLKPCHCPVKPPISHTLI